MERELITQHQANVFMIALLIVAPLLGWAWGVRTKQIGRGLTLGLLVGVGNFVLWTVYNEVTDRLGLDTVKNLLVNLALFAAVGVAVGLGAARWGDGAWKGKT